MREMSVGSELLFRQEITEIIGLYFYWEEPKRRTRRLPFLVMCFRERMNTLNKWTQSIVYNLHLTKGNIYGTDVVINIKHGAIVHRYLDGFSRTFRHNGSIFESGRRECENRRMIINADCGRDISVPEILLELLVAFIEISE